MSIQRFAKTIRSGDLSAASELTRYFRNRAVQLLPLGWSWSKELNLHTWGAKSPVTHRATGEIYLLAYLYEDKQGSGEELEWLMESSVPVVLMEDQEALRYALRRSPPPAGYAEAGSDYLRRFDPMGREIDRFPVLHPCVVRALQTIRSFYGDRHARRSGLPLMNHICEGLYLLQQLRAEASTLAAWCLHPLVQSDQELLDSLAQGRLTGQDPVSVALAMEYRCWANQHLSHHPPRLPSWGPLEPVRQLLAVDKVQNHKDFQRLLKRRADVPNRERLAAYFQEWFQALGISEEDPLRSLLS